MKKPPFRASAVVCAVKDHISCELEGESVILNMKDGVYYGLNAVGNSVWSLIQEPRKVEAILSSLVKEYDVDAEQCASDLQELLQNLLTAGLIEVTDEPAGETP